MDDSAKRNAAYAAAKNGRCPECERATVVSQLKQNPDGSFSLRDASCAALDCEWRWP